MLQLRKYSIQNTELGPAIHACVDRVPVAKSLGQATPLAAVLGYVQDRIQHLQIRKTDVASLPRKAVFDLLVLGLCDFHAQIVGEK
jgi:hypothetical protein